jgi:hypothetical protein
MAELQLTDYTSILKEILLPYVRDNFPKKTILLDQMKRNSGITLMNDEFIAPIWTTRHGGIANLANDTVSIVNAGGRASSRGTVGVKIATGALDITKLAIDASRSNTLAVESALTAQTKLLANDFARQMNRQLYSDGVGVVSQVSGSVATSIASLQTPDANLDDGRSVDWYGTINGDISPTKYLAIDQHVGLGTAGAAIGTVTAVSGTSITLTSGAPAIAAYDSVFVLDGSNTAAGTSEIQGIRLALSSSTGTSTYAGLARTNPGWTPQFGSSSEALTLSRMELGYLAAGEYADTSDTFIILVNKTLFKKYGDILTSMRRAVNTADLLGGWKGLEFAAGGGNVGVFLDYDVPDGEVLIINLDTWTLCQVSDVDWLEDPNGGGLLRVSNSIKYQAVMVWFVNTMCLCPGANARETRKTG